MAGFELRHLVHGLPLSVRSQDPLVNAAAKEAVGGFPERDDDGAQALEIVMHSVERLAEVPLIATDAAVLVRETPDVKGTVPCRLYRDAAGWLIDFGGAGRMSLDLEAGTANCWLVQPGRQAPDWAASFVLLAAIELLRSRGLYAIHGAGLEREGRGILIVGVSGAGKTTSCLSLMRAGFGCLSDDHPLLQASGCALSLLPFPGRIAVTERTADWFPELCAAQHAFRQDTRKRSFELESFPCYRAGQPCRPEMLIFPRIVDWPQSSLEELPKTRALEELLPQTLLVLDQALAVRQFQVMADLVKKARCFRLHFGEDVARLPELVDGLLQQFP